MMGVLFTSEMLLGFLLGGIYAVGDAMLLRRTVRQSGESPTQNWFLRGMLGRTLLTAGVIILALLLPFVNAAGVVIALIIQKSALVIVAFRNLLKP